jgi:hypothetical protein
VCGAQAPPPHALHGQAACVACRRTPLHCMGRRRGVCGMQPPRPSRSAWAGGCHPAPRGPERSTGSAPPRALRASSSPPEERRLLYQGRGWWYPQPEEQTEEVEGEGVSPA